MRGLPILEVAFYGYSKVALWIMITLAAIIALGIIIIAAYHCSSKKNKTLQQRSKNLDALTINIAATALVYFASYIVLVSASKQYRNASLAWGLALFFIGIAITLAVVFIGLELSVKIWNRAHLERRHWSRAIKRLKRKNDYYRDCIIDSKSIMDLNPYAEDLPPAND